MEGFSILAGQLFLILCVQSVLEAMASKWQSGFMQKPIELGCYIASLAVVLRFMENLSSGYSARPDAFFLKVQNFYKKYLTKGGKNDNILLVLSTSYADVAQLAEQLTCNQQVIGSSPIIGFLDL